VQDYQRRQMPGIAASARVGEKTNAEQLTLRFAASTMLTGIKSSNDFQVEHGSSCKVQAFYSPTR
jgi:hypothetical protein